MSRSVSPSHHERPLILVVEDQPAQQVAVTTALEARGYRVSVAGTGRQALDAAGAVEPDVVILDLGLPDIDGLDLCRRLRAILRCPIVVVTADAVEDHVVTALDIGADDYVIKPFSIRELLARIRVAMRHRAMTAVPDDDLLMCGDLRIDVAGHVVTVAGEEIELQARPFAALTLLVRNEGRVVTYSRISEALGGSRGGAPDANGLRIMLSKIRKQLGTGPNRPQIHTETKVGYRLVRPD